MKNLFRVVMIISIFITACNGGDNTTGGEDDRIGLGEISANSSLNQPLDAEIQLPVQQGTLQSVRITMADQQDFDRANIVWQDWMDGVTFKI